jgi:hypothetical protein
MLQLVIEPAGYLPLFAVLLISGLSGFVGHLAMQNQKDYNPSSSLTGLAVALDTATKALIALLTLHVVVQVAKYFGA